MTRHFDHVRHWTICVATALLAGCAPAPEPVRLGIPGRANANPSIAAQGQFVSVVWGAATPAGSMDVYASVSRDGGRRFSSAVRVNSVEGAARLNGEQPPRVVLLERADEDPAVIVVWTAAGTRGTMLLQARSDDSGASFDAQAVVPGTDAEGNRGWHAIAASRDAVAAVWLDHREMAAESASGGAHHHHAQGAESADAGSADGTARAQMSKLYFGFLNAAAPQAVTGGVCYCCKTTLTAGEDGALYAAWRHVFPGNVRDIAFTVSRDQGRTFATPVRVSADDWVLNGCPENGPSIAVDAAGHIHIAWPTLIEAGGEPTLALFYAVSRDGRTFTPRQQLPTEDVPRHVQLAVDVEGQVFAAWDEGSEGTRHLALARGIPDQTGRMRFDRSRDRRDSAATYPVLAAAEDDVLVAWTSGGATDSVIRVEAVQLNDR